MNVKPVKTSEIRLDLENIFGRISDPTWAKMRSTLIVDGHWVTQPESLGFWAYMAMRRDNQTRVIKLEDIIQFIEDNGENPRQWFPYFVSTASLALPDDINGDELRVYLKNALGWSLSRNQLNAYCLAVCGRKATANQVFTERQVQEVIRYRCRMMANRSQKQIESGNKLAKWRKAS